MKQASNTQIKLPPLNDRKVLIQNQPYHQINGENNEPQILQNHSLQTMNQNYSHLQVGQIQSNSPNQNMILSNSYPNQSNQTTSQNQLYPPTMLNPQIIHDEQTQSSNKDNKSSLNEQPIQRQSQNQNIKEYLPTNPLDTSLNPLSAINKSDRMIQNTSSYNNINHNNMIPVGIQNVNQNSNYLQHGDQLTQSPQNKRKIPLDIENQQEIIMKANQNYRYQPQQLQQQQQEVENGNIIQTNGVFSYQAKEIEVYQKPQQMVKQKMNRLCSLKKKESINKINNERLKKKDSLPYYVQRTTNDHVYRYADTYMYQNNDCCCHMLYKDDCCLKWICDLIFQLFFLPFRIIAYIFYNIGIQFCKEQCRTCNSGFIKCFYSPFKCYGDWINQCWFSFRNFCCNGIDFIPGNIQQVYTNSCQKCFLECGQFCKNCCSFPIDCNCQCCKACPDFTDLCRDKDQDCICNRCFHCLGDCCQSCCTPQGFCESLFHCFKSCSCNIINQVCLKNICGCCVKIIQIQIGNGVAQFAKCCCCFIESSGQILVAIIGSLLK